MNKNLSGRFWPVFFFVFATVGLLIAIDNNFNLALFGTTIIENSYLYLLLGLFGSMGYLTVGINGKAKTKLSEGAPWYDITAICLIAGISFYFALNGFNIIYQGWEFSAPLPMKICSVIMWVLIMEAVRRVAGTALCTICFFFSLYPLFAHVMPGPLEGASFPFLTIMPYHFLSYASVLGIPMRVFGNLLMGFILFGCGLMVAGGGQFFLDLASSLFGSTRGGIAKVAVVSSALFASTSGSVISNVVTTGSLTIPAMKKGGYPPKLAGAIEACASTGGVLTPPVMGSVAFIMASFLNVSYIHIMIVAAVPAVLYYLGIFAQVDAYAANNKLAGFSREHVPPFWKTLAKGWVFVVSFLLLVFLLAYMKRVSQAPFLATLPIAGLMAYQVWKKRVKPRIYIDLLMETGKLLVTILVPLAGIGFILGALSVTGVGMSLSREIIWLAGGNIYLLLLMGALASFVLGMGMTISACYVFLAIVLAPALVGIGLDRFAVHMFIAYWGMVSYITPPVALAAYTAAGIAGASATKTGFYAMRLGVAIYIVPFVFILAPALILQGAVPDIILHVITAVFGIMLIGQAFERRLPFVGRVGIPLQLLTLAFGLVFILPFDIYSLFGFGIFAVILLGRFLKWGETSIKPEGGITESPG